MPINESTQNDQSQNNKKDSLKLRAVLLFLQVLLPFGLYYVMELQNIFIAAVIAALFTVSMGFLVWLG